MKWTTIREVCASQAYPRAVGDRRVTDEHIAMMVCQTVSNPDPKPYTIYIIPEFTHLGLKINKAVLLHLKQKFEHIPQIQNGAGNVQVPVPLRQK